MRYPPRQSAIPRAEPPQHRAETTRPRDEGQLQALLHENRVLARALGKAQERCTRAMAAQIVEIDRLQARLMQQQARFIVQTSRQAFQVRDLAHRIRALAIQAIGATWPAWPAQTVSIPVAEHAAELRAADPAIDQRRHIPGQVAV